MSSNSATEISAIQAVHAALEPLDGEARTRVLAYIISLLGMDAKLASGRSASPSATAASEDDDLPEEVVSAETTKQLSTYSTFAELYAAANPKSNPERVLVVGYWLQVCRAGDSFTAASANKELKHLGHQITNITAAIDQMKKNKPMLILQLKKSGNSQQARKLYKVSHEGVSRVEKMLRG